MMEFIFAAPALVKVLGSLALVLGFNSFSKNLLASLGAGTLILALWSGHSLLQAGVIALEGTATLNNFFLIMIIVLVICLSGQMAKTGVMKEIVGIVKGASSRRFSLAVLPAIIGLLPMPGGAVFSAPLVDDCDSEGAVEPILKTKINYWFRHIWEYWWPLYPGVLLAVELSGIKVWQFMLVQLPMTLFAVIGGYFLLLRRVKKGKAQRAREPVAMPFLKRVLPILMVIGSYLFFQILFPQVVDFNKYLPIAAGLVLAMVTLQIQRPLSWDQWRKIIFSKKTFSMALLMLVIRIYGAFVQADLPGGGGLIANMRLELEGLGIPVLASVMIIPFICGITSGIVVGCVGASFPIVISLLGPSPEFGMLLGTVILAFGSGYVGILLSPIHVCLIVTNEYFQTKLGHSLLRLVPSVAVVIAGTLICSTAVKWLF